MQYLIPQEEYTGEVEGQQYGPIRHKRRNRRHSNDEQARLPDIDRLVQEIHQEQMPMGGGGSFEYEKFETEKHRISQMLDDLVLSMRKRVDVLMNKTKESLVSFLDMRRAAYQTVETDAELMPLFQQFLSQRGSPVSSNAMPLVVDVIRGRDEDRSWDGRRLSALLSSCCQEGEVDLSREINALGFGEDDDEGKSVSSRGSESGELKFSDASSRANTDNARQALEELKHNPGEDAFCQLLSEMESMAMEINRLVVDVKRLNMDIKNKRDILGEISQYSSVGANTSEGKYCFLCSEESKSMYQTQQVDGFFRDNIETKSVETVVCSIFFYYALKIMPATKRVWEPGVIFEHYDRHCITPQWEFVQSIRYYKEEIDRLRNYVYQMSLEGKPTGPRLEVLKQIDSMRLRIAQCLQRLAVYKKGQAGRK